MTVFDIEKIFIYLPNAKLLQVFLLQPKALVSITQIQCNLI